jgi:predicted porin
MNKGKAIICAGILQLACTGANAETSVTLFGVVDTGLTYTNNAGGHSATQMSSIDLLTNHWGIKGSEDLGDGLHAIFDLESGFAMESGKILYPGRIFGYESFVGLQSDTYGTVTFGRQFDSFTDVISVLTANGMWAGCLFSHPLDNDNTDGSYHASNSIKFTTASMRGVTATVLYGFSNKAGSWADNRALSAGVSYTYKTLLVGVGYESLSAPGSTAQGAVASDDYGIASKSQKTYGIGVNYGIGDLTLGAVYTRANIDEPTSSAFIGPLIPSMNSLKFDNFEVNARYNVTAALMVGGMYTYSRAQVGLADQSSTIHWNQVGAMAQYSLSKRTSINSQLVYQHVSGTSGTNLDFAYITASAGPSSTRSQFVARLGLTHAF